jgi:predicted GNAT superfamily acetyltransferase
LKLAQRERALARGIGLITWTFDPLQSVNAHLNVGKLGVVSEKYRVNFYGETSSSFLHRTGTDRLWVSWVLNSERVKRRIRERLAPASSSVRAEESEPMVVMGEQGAPVRDESIMLRKPAAVSIQIPGDLVGLQQQAPELAILWREATRWAFTEAIAAGYLVEEFYRPEKDGRRSGTYLLNAGRKIADLE